MPAVDRVTPAATTAVIGRETTGLSEPGWGGGDYNWVVMEKGILSGRPNPC